MNGDSYPKVEAYHLAVNPEKFGHREDSEIALIVDTDEGSVIVSMNLITAQVIANQLGLYVAALAGYDGDASGFSAYWAKYQDLVLNAVAKDRFYE